MERKEVVGMIFPSLTAENLSGTSFKPLIPPTPQLVEGAVKALQ